MDSNLCFLTRTSPSVDVLYPQPLNDLKNNTPHPLHRNSDFGNGRTHTCAWNGLISKHCLSSSSCLHQLSVSRILGTHQPSCSFDLFPEESQSPEPDLRACPVSQAVTTWEDERWLGERWMCCPPQSCYHQAVCFKYNIFPSPFSKEGRWVDR